MKLKLFWMAIFFAQISFAQDVLMKSISFNLGHDVTDYWHLWQMYGAKFYDKPVSFEEYRDITERKYPATEWATAMRIIEDVDVLMLKNVGRLERPFMVVARELGFSTYKFSRKSSGYFDTAVLLGKNFELIEDHSFFHTSSLRDAAIVKARHRATNIVITFASLHVPGPLNSRVTLSDLTLGDSYCKEVARRLKKIAKQSFLVIGADMGANQFRNTSRFEHFTKLGVELYPTGQVTRFDSLEPFDTQFEAVDYFFVNKPLHARRRITTFKGKEILRSSVGIANDLWRFTDFNFSSHAPIFLVFYYNPKHLKRIDPPSSY